MAAYPDHQATSELADLILELADDAGRDVETRDGNESGFLVPQGETLVITDHNTGARYLVAVHRVDEPKNDDHGYDLDTDRCSCGGVIVYFEDGDRDGREGEGCEVGGRVFQVVAR